MATWESEHTKYSKELDKQVLTMDALLKKYKPEFDAVINSAYRKWAIDGVLKQQDLYEILTPKETTLFKKQISRWINDPIYSQNKQFVTKMKRVLLRKRLRRTDFLELNFHKVATKIKYYQHGYLVNYLYNDWLDASRTVARLMNESFTVAGDDIIYATINKKFNGTDLLSRVYNLATDLADRWQKLVKNALGKLGKKLEALKPMLEFYFSKGDGVARNQMRVEATRINTASKLDSFKRLDIKYLQFIAVMDSVTTNVCRHQDLKVIRVDKAVQGENVPPLINEVYHTCRSTIKAYDIDDRTNF